MEPAEEDELYTRLREQVDRLEKSKLFKARQILWLRGFTSKTAIELRSKDDINQTAFLCAVAEHVHGRRDVDIHAGPRIIGRLSRRLDQYYEKNARDPGPMRIGVGGGGWFLTWTPGEPLVPDQPNSGDLEMHSDSQSFDNRMHGILTELESASPSRTDLKDIDLRILVTAFPTTAFPEGRLRKLVREKNLKLQVILMNPDHAELLKARHGARQDYETAESAKASIVHQHKRLSQFPTETPGGGSFEIKLSNLMPLGFYMLTKTRALLGWYWADNSFHRGPLIEVDAESPLWKALEKDWIARWEYKG